MQVDDLSVGKWIMITGPRSVPREPWDDDMMIPQQANPFEGLPIRVLAISLPFVAVAANDQVMRVDTRKFSFTRATKKYRDIVCGKTAAPVSSVAEERSDTVCPRCKRRLVHRRTLSNVWQWFCPNCELPMPLS